MKSDREGEISYGISSLWNLKRNDTNELTYKIETDWKALRTTLWLLGARMGEGILRELGMGVCTLVYLKWITKEDCVAHETAQCCVAAWMGREFWGE